MRIVPATPKPIVLALPVVVDSSARAAAAWLRRLTTVEVGWPNELPTPHDTTASSGRRLATRLRLVDVLLPWWFSL